MEYGPAIEDALAKGNISEAARIAEAALAAGLVEPLFYNLLAWKHETEGDLVAAEAMLEHALRLSPDDPFILIGLGSLRRKQGRMDEAITVLDLAIRGLPENPGAWLERGYAFEDSGLLDRAAENYRQAARLDPDMAAAHAGLASALSRLGQFEQARREAGEALELDPSMIAAHCALARCDIEDGRPGGGIQRLLQLLERNDVPVVDEIIARGLLGDAHNRLGEAEPAFQHYSEAKTLFANARRAQDRSDVLPMSQREFIESISREVEGSPADEWRPDTRPDDEPGRCNHAFLIGYPRSGTTLVESILAVVPNVDTAEEQPTLRDADLAFLAPTLRLDQLRQVDPGMAAHFREAYWDRVERLGIDATGKLFVDMDPLKGIKLPLIAKLFPYARIIAMRRDPRDVVWSCFHTNFAPSAAAYEFTDLERAARHYDALMTLTELCFEKLPLRRFVLRYEDLVRDFDEVTQALCAFLDLEWTEGLRDFNTSAAKRNVTTASVSQVRKGLYDGGGQWKLYEDRLAPVLPILEPWIEKFGYSA